MRTGLSYVPAIEHTKWGHPENDRRGVAIYDALARQKLLSQFFSMQPKEATVSQLTKAHTPQLVSYVHQAAMGGRMQLDLDTYITTASYTQAALAAGSSCQLIDHIYEQKIANGLAVIRPPGHHAEKNRSGGFCLFNNVAVAARHAQMVHGAKKIWIIDFDIHHGNGTQDIFYNNGDVLFSSIHLFLPGRFYPGTGGEAEIGIGAGKQFTVNVPLPPGIGDRGYLEIWKQLLMPRGIEFQPELILVSAGYDAHWQDPLSLAALSSTGYSLLSRALVEFADQYCDGRILFVLEGGYLLEAVSEGVINTAYALLHQDQLVDKLGKFDGIEQSISDLLPKWCARHLRN